LHQNYFISRENGTYSVKSIRILLSVIKIISQFNQLAEHRSNLLAMSTKLYVGNLPDSAKDKDLRELFQAFGEVDEVAVLRGYGFVHFVKSDDAGAALSALDDSEFMGSHIQVQVPRLSTALGVSNCHQFVF